MQVTYPTVLILLSFVILIIFPESVNYKSLCFAIFSNFLLSPDLNIPLNTPVWEG